MSVSVPLERAAFTVELRRSGYQAVRKIVARGAPVPACFTPGPYGGCCAGPRIYGYEAQYSFTLPRASETDDVAPALAAQPPPPRTDPIAPSPRAKTWMDRAEKQLASGRPGDALESANRAVAMAKDAPEPYVLRGRILVALGNSAGAVPEFDTALRLGAGEEALALRAKAAPAIAPTAAPVSAVPGPPPVAATAPSAPAPEPPAPQAAPEAPAPASAAPGPATSEPPAPPPIVPDADPAELARRPRAAEGLVVHAGDGEVVIDLGAQAGLAPGSRLWVFRKVAAVHPLTQRRIEDRVFAGALHATEVGARLTIARDISGLRQPPRVGDSIIYVPPAPAALPPPPAAAPSTPPPPAPVPEEPADTRPPEQRALSAATSASLGRPLTERIANFQRYLDAHPLGEHVDAVRKEIAYLEDLLAAERKLAVALQPPGGTPLARADHSAPVQHDAGTPLEVAVAFTDEHRVEQLRVLARREGEPRYHTVAMRRDGDSFYRARLPDALVEEPGNVEYVVEAVRTDARLEPVAGSIGRPFKVRVVPAQREDPSGHSDASARFEWAEFFLARPGGDFFTQTEVAFDYGVRWGMVHAFRVGAGNITGSGGSKDAVEKGRDSALEQVAYSYGFAELEIQPVEQLGLSARLIGGTNQRAREAVLDRVTGVEARLRAGPAAGPHLVLGGGVIERHGARLFAEARATALEKFPLRGAVEVTSLPLGLDPGVRVTADAGWRPLDWVSFRVIAGWNARTIDHQGITLGGGVSMSW